VRAEILWGIIQRCHRAFGASAADGPLSDDLQQQVAEHVTAQAASILELVDNRKLSDSLPPGTRAYIPDAMRTRRDELIRKFSNEVQFYVQTLRRAAGAEAGDRAHITIHGNVGAIQTGPVLVGAYPPRHGAERPVAAGA
jgi:hypothetical protein